MWHPVILIFSTDFDFCKDGLVIHIFTYCVHNVYHLYYLLLTMEVELSISRTKDLPGKPIQVCDNTLVDVAWMSVKD